MESLQAAAAHSVAWTDGLPPSMALYTPVDGVLNGTAFSTFFSSVINMPSVTGTAGSDTVTAWLSDAVDTEKDLIPTTMLSRARACPIAVLCTLLSQGRNI